MKTILSAALVATICMYSTAHAATVNRIAYQNGGVGDPGCGTGIITSETDTTDLSASYSQSAAGCNMSISVEVVGGGIGIFAQASSFPGGNFANRAQVSGSHQVRDIFLTPLFDPATYTGPNVISVSANLVVEGDLMSEIRSDARFVRSAAAGVTATATLGGGRFGAGNTTSDRQRFDERVGITNSMGDGTDTRVIIGTLTPRIQHDWRIPLSLIMQYSGSAGANGGRDSAAFATLDSRNTFSFSKTGPAFDIPSIFTVNAPELNIFNNRWIDPRITVDPSAVPLPAGLPLLLAGLGALGLIRRVKGDTR